MAKVSKAPKTTTRIGDILRGRYQIVGLAGEGGMSIVWDARDIVMDVRRAVKEVKMNANENYYRVNVDALRREAQLMKGFDHPLLPHIYDIIEEKGHLYVVMEYIEGRDLSQVLRDTLRDTGRAIDEASVVDWGKQLCEALQYLHSSVIDPATKQPRCIVYRDMKPGNVKLRDDGTVRIFDFGIARVYSEDKTDDTMALGTRGYASPEAFAKGDQTTPRSDIYSLGVTLFHLVTGFGPMEFIDKPNLPPIRSLNPQLSEGLEMVIIRCTQWDPALRYQSCTEMLWDLEHLDDIIGPVIEAKQRKVRNFKTLAVTAACCLVLGAGCLAGSMVVKSTTVDGLLDRAERASTTETGGTASEAEELCMEAIEADPANIQPYLTLVSKVYSGDGSFSKEESARWTSLYNDNKSRISGNDEYAYLCYKVGLLYFNSYGDGYDVANSSMAKTYFDQAISTFESKGARGSNYGSKQNALAEVYSTFGGFSQLLIDKMNEGSESEAYATYFEAFETGVEDVHASGDSALAQMRMYEIAFDSINSEDSLTNFKKAGISEARASSLLTKIYNYTLEIGSSGPEQTKDVYEQITSEYNTAKAKIEAVFNNAGTGGVKSSTTSSRVSGSGVASAAGAAGAAVSAGRKGL